MGWPPENCCAEGMQVVGDFRDEIANRQDYDPILAVLRAGYASKRVKVVNGCPGRGACALKSAGCLSPEPTSQQLEFLEAELPILIDKLSAATDELPGKDN